MKRRLGKSRRQAADWPLPGRRENQLVEGPRRYMRIDWTHVGTSHRGLCHPPFEPCPPWSFFMQILDEVEKRHQISMAVIYPFMQGLREAAFPAPGKTVTLKSFIPDSGTEVG